MLIKRGEKGGKEEEEGTTAAKEITKPKTKLARQQQANEFMSMPSSRSLLLSLSVFSCPPISSFAVPLPWQQWPLRRSEQSGEREHLIRPYLILDMLSLLSIFGVGFRYLSVRLLRSSLYLLNGSVVFVSAAGSAGKMRWL